jgi:hypothetical protein
MGVCLCNRHLDNRQSATFIRTSIARCFVEIISYLCLCVHFQRMSCNICPVIWACADSSFLGHVSVSRHNAHNF